MGGKVDRRELLDPFAGMLASCCAPADIRRIEAGGTHLEMWEAIESSGFLQALVPESQGGIGLRMASVAPLFMALGGNAVPLPVAETMIARSLLSNAGIGTISGSIALACQNGAGSTFVPYGRVCDHVLIDDGSALQLFDVRQLERQYTNVPGSVDAWLNLPKSGEALRIIRPGSGISHLGALVSAAAISGAADRLLDMTTTYANERVQFGKPIGRQQALQQQLAVMAEDVIAVRLAAELACQNSFLPSEIPAATAKIIASNAAVRIANTAHAVFGAIGISAEHDLQLFTRRLHNWRQAFGSEQYWQIRLGAKRLKSELRSIDWVRNTYEC